MHLKITFFADLREKMNRRNLELDVEDVQNIRELKERLEEKFDCLKGCFSESSAVRTALNHEYCSEETKLKDGDEVAFFPPVTGG